MGRMLLRPAAGISGKRAEKCTSLICCSPKHPLFTYSPPMGVFVGRIQYAPTAGATPKRASFFYTPRWRTPKCAAFYSYPERSTPKFDPFCSYPSWRASKFDPFPDSPPMGVFVGRIQYVPTAGETSKRDPFWDSPRWMTPKRDPF